MEGWTNIGDIISNFNFKGRAKKKFLIDNLKDRIKRIFGIKEFFEIDFFRGKLEIRVKNNILAQELFLEKEKVKEEIKKILEEIDPEVEIREVFIKKI